jgi:Fic family protein
MDIKEFVKNFPGKLKETKGTTPESKVFAFIPDKLPPKLEYDLELTNLLAQAESSLGKLSSAGRFLPNPHLLISPYLKQEAVLSSKIEGTQASLSDYFIYEAIKKEIRKDIGLKEIENYVEAATQALESLKKEKISIRLIQDMHKILVRGVRGDKLIPGEIRGTQNWIGPEGCKIEDATFVPPTALALPDLLLDLQGFINNPLEHKDIRPLIQCALMHYQFESIHPFFDGNGRIGRLLIILYLCENKLLSQPLLYLSAYFEKNRGEYYKRLREVSMKNNWISWVKFFLKGIAIQAEAATRVSEKIMDLQKKYALDLQKNNEGNLKTQSLMAQLFINPYITIPTAQKILNTSFPTAKAHIKILEKLGIVREVAIKNSKAQVYLAEELFKTIMNS